MTTLKFKIGDGFPADDPVARFITVIAMMSNDWLRSTTELLGLDDADPDAGGRRVMLFRQQAALYHEAATFITDSRRRFSDIDSFINGLDQDARYECDQVVGALDADSPHYLGDWLVDHRNVTFHYPHLHPDRAAHGKEEIAEALKAAAGLKGSITMDEHFGSVRFRFADDVAVQWLPDSDTQVHLIAALREAVMALGRFAQRAAQTHLESRPDGTLSVE